MSDDDKNFLILDHLVFDEISFKRLGFKNENKFDPELQIKYGHKDDTNKGVVSLILSGEKKEEYNLKVSLSGFFRFKEGIDLKLKEELLKKNAVAILMPYLRSQISLLTSQPETDTFVFPIINVSSLIEEKSE